MLKSYTNIPFRHLWCVSLFGRPRNVFGVRKISDFAEIWFPLLQQWTHFLCFWHLIVFWFGKILTVFSHAPKSKWFWRHRGPTKISCQTRSPFHLKETSVNLMEIGVPLVEMSIQIMGIGFPLMEIGFPLMRTVIHVKEIGIPRMETLLHLMQIGFPLKESSILLKHASARGAEPVAQQRPRITDMGRLRAEGAWNRWFHQRPRSNDQGAASNCEICTEASGTEQF